MLLNAVFNYQAHVEDASKRCIEVRTGALPAPRGLVAWLAPNGHLVLNWQHVEGPDTPKYEKFIVLFVTSMVIAPKIIYY